MGVALGTWHAGLCSHPCALLIPGRSGPTEGALARPCVDTPIGRCPLATSWAWEGRTPSTEDPVGSHSGKRPLQPRGTVPAPGSVQPDPEVLAGPVGRRWPERDHCVSCTACGLERTPRTWPEAMSLSATPTDTPFAAEELPVTCLFVFSLKKL